MYSCRKKFNSRFRLKRIGSDPINPLKIEEPTSRGALPITGYDVTLRIGNLFMFALVRSLFLPTRQVLVCELSITLQRRQQGAVCATSILYKRKGESKHVK